MHLPSTFTAYAALSNAPELRVAILGDHGLAWPWESLHVEALAWFDHWLKGRDTGILEGPAFRYILPGADGWRSASQWPIPEVSHQPYFLQADATLGSAADVAGSREMMTLGAGVGAAQA